MKNCPYCAEEIRDEAVRCPHCRSRLGTFKSAEWHRGHPEAVVGGVASALAHAFSVPVALVRLGFIVTAFFHFAGAIAYAALWLVIPKHPGEPSVLETSLGRAQQAARRMSAGHGCGHCGSRSARKDVPNGAVNGVANGEARTETPSHATGA